MNFNKSISVIYKIFFIWLLLQFFLFNIITFSFWLDGELMKFVWLWKELLLVGLFGLTLLLIFTHKQRKIIFPNSFITFMKLLLALTIWITIYLNLSIHQSSWWVYALAFKYDFLWFIILFIWFHSSHFIDQQSRTNLVHRYWKVLKWSLLGALIRYVVVFIKPWTLKLFGYNNFLFEWSAWGQAPAVYYTHINQWLPRSSFLFERPTTWGFYLIAFFPLFYFLFLHQKRVRHTRAWRWIYGVNILLTFSRAARWARVIELIILGILLAGKNIKKLKSLFIKWLLPLLFIIWVVWFFGRKQIFAREYSNTWHIAMLQKWIQMSIEKPLTWWWPATAWPWSHWDSNSQWFNPENQFLQIYIEYGAVWFIPWVIFFISLCLIWSVPFLLNNRTIQYKSNTSWEISWEILLFSCSLWLIWLAACWMILHSFVDRMVVYPFMLLFGIILYEYYFEHANASLASKK